MGSSPLARGTPGSPERRQCHLGLIPARAGNTRSMTMGLQIGGAHPRSRGEHSCLLPVFACTPGSSPLARGTPLQLFQSEPRLGLIPARAGNTIRRRSGRARTGAHPRSRGEHRPSLARSRIHPGSSPLARGTPLIFIAFESALGLIPARAGNT